MGRGRLPGEVPFTVLFPDSPLPNPPCEFPRHGLSSDYAVSNAAMCSACVRHNSGCLEVPVALERRSAGRHLLAGAKLPRDADSAGLAGA